MLYDVGGMCCGFVTVVVRLFLSGLSSHWIEGSRARVTGGVCMHGTAVRHIRGHPLTAVADLLSLFAAFTDLSATDCTNHTRAGDRHVRHQYLTDVAFRVAVYSSHVAGRSKPNGDNGICRSWSSKSRVCGLLLALALEVEERSIYGGGAGSLRSMIRSRSDIRGAAADCNRSADLMSL